MWVDSPLIEAAKSGTPVILDNFHAARTDVLLGSLGRLLVDREVELPDGVLLKSAERMPHGLSGAVDGATDCPNVLVIPPTFRVLALGTTSAARNPLAPEAASLFSLHSLAPIAHAKMGELAATLYPGADSNRVNQLAVFGEKLEDMVENQKAKLSDTEARSLQLSLRLFCRLCRFLQAFPETDAEGLVPYIHDGMLTPFMPLSTRAMVDELLVESGLRPADGRHDEARPPNQINVSGGYLHVGGQRVPIATPQRPELVPAAVDFFANASHTAVLYSLLQAHAAGERALLLIGSQGVGKNRLADKLIAMLGREREYIQLHRDSTLSSLTLVPSIENGQIVWQDSPLVRAARYGRILLVDEADKAPLEVVALLKQLVEDGNVLLGNGQRLSRGRPSSSGEDQQEEEGVITIHPDFSLWVLANPAGFPFLGNNLFAECGDVCRTVVVHNPDRASEVQILMRYGPSIPLTTLSHLAAAFGELRDMHAKNQLTYPYSLREAVATVKHLEEFQGTDLAAALSGVLSFDSFDTRLVAQLAVVFKKHDIDIGVPVTELQLQFERIDGS